MNPKLKELREKFAKCMHDSEEIRLKYNGTPENMSDEELGRYDQFLLEADGLKSQIERMEKGDRIDAWAKQAQERPRFTGKDETSEDVRRKELHFKAFRRYLSGQPEMNNKAWMETPEFKAYQADNPAGGGFTVMPQQLVSDILTLMKDLVYVRGLATRYEVPNAESLGVPAIDTEPSDSDWTAELAVGSEETTAAIGKRELRPAPLAKYIKLSKKLLRQVPNFDTVILDRLAYKMAITEEKAFLSGSGANQPLGVYTADNNGIGTSRDITAAGASAIAADDVIKVFFNLKAQYRARSTWIINRTVVQAIRLLKDTTNNYIWTAGYGTGQQRVVSLDGLGPGGGLQGTPDLLMGRPVLESEYAPGTITTGLYTMIVGDFSKYWIADALDMQMQVLYELFALTNQMGYILRKETDGMPVLAEAFSRLKQA